MVNAVDFYRFKFKLLLYSEIVTITVYLFFRIIIIMYFPLHAINTIQLSN